MIPVPLTEFRRQPMDLYSNSSRGVTDSNPSRQRIPLKPGSVLAPLKKEDEEEGDHGVESQ